MSLINNNFWFILGSFPQISIAEIISVLNLKKEEFKYSEPFLAIKNKLISADVLINQLAGTVKIAQIIKQVKTENEIIDSIVQILNQSDKKINFGISLYSSNKNDSPYSWGKEIKKILKEKNIASRFVFNKQAILSSATVYHNKLINNGFEFIIKKENNYFLIGQTKAVQPFEDWNERDFNRPKKDSLSGMLPPKIARILINLSSKNPTNSTLLDPFCGSGTIINEAILLNFKKIIGSDISEKAITDSKINTEWLIKKYTLKNPNVQFIKSDVANLTIKDIDLVVTEPYLGKPLKGNEKESTLKHQIEYLEKLYLESLKNLYSLLKPAGEIIMIIPCFKFKQNWLRINLLSEIKKIGFIPNPFFDKDFLFYARDNQKVGREIWRFKKIKH